MAADYPSTEHFEAVVTDRAVEDPWVMSKVRPGERLLDVGSATSRFLQDLPEGCRVCAIDLRPTPPREGVTVVQGDLILAPFRASSFDVITCISTVEHVGLDVYGQGPDEFGDEVATRHMRRLLRPGGRLLLTAPFGQRVVSAWHRIYDHAALRRVMGGYRLLSVQYYRREGERYLPCRRDEIDGAGFDYINMRSDGVVLLELTPAGGLPFLLARLSLQLRRRWRKLTRRGPFWSDPSSGQSATEWLKERQEEMRRRRPR